MSRQHWYECGDPLAEVAAVQNGWEKDLSTQDANQQAFKDRPLADREGVRPVPISVLRTEPHTDMTEHFLTVTAPLITVDRQHSQRIVALRLSGVRMTQRVRQRIRALAPLQVLDLSTYDLTAQQLVEVYQSVGARCCVIFGKSSSLKLLTEFVLPVGLLEHRNLSNFLAFLNRVHYGDRPWIHQLTALDFSVSRVGSVDRFQALNGRPYLPENIKTLSLDGIIADRIDLSALSQCKSITHLSLRGCGFDLMHAGDILRMPALRSVALEDNAVSQVAWLQVVARVNRDDSVIEAGTDEKSKEAGLFCRFARKHRGVILSQARSIIESAEDKAVAAGELEAKPDPEVQHSEAARALCAVSDYVCIEPSIIHNRVRKSAKTFRLTRGTSYRNLPYEHFARTPGPVLNALRALFSSVDQLSGVEGERLITHLIAAQAIARSPLFTNATKGQPSLFQGEVSLDYLHYMEERLCHELALMRLSCQYYQAGSNPIKLAHISELAHGAKLLLAVCRSMIKQSNELTVGHSGLLAFGERQARAIMADQQLDLSVVSLVSVRVPDMAGISVDAPVTEQGYARLLS